MLLDIMLQIMVFILMVIMGGNMRKIIFTMMFILVSPSAFAQYVVTGQGPITGNVYVMSPYQVPVMMAPPPVVVEQPVIVQQPVVVQKQVVVQPRPVCTTYPDPWDTLGYLFGNPFMITTCY